MAGLERLGRSFTEILVRLGGVAVLLLTAWLAFKVLISGATRSGPCARGWSPS